MRRRASVTLGGVFATNTQMLNAQSTHNEKRKASYCIIVIAFGVLLFVSATAQEHSKAEVFGGYQFSRLDRGVNLNG